MKLQQWNVVFFVRSEAEFILKLPFWYWIQLRKDSLQVTIQSSDIGFVVDFDFIKSHQLHPWSYPTILHNFHENSHLSINILKTNLSMFQEFFHMCFCGDSLLDPLLEMGYGE